MCTSNQTSNIPDMNDTFLKMEMKRTGKRVKTCHLSKAILSNTRKMSSNNCIMAGREQIWRGQYFDGAKKTN